MSAALRETPAPASEEKEFPLDCGEALGQVQDSVCFVATSFEYASQCFAFLVQCFEKCCDDAALR